MSKRTSNKKVSRLFVVFILGFFLASTSSGYIAAVKNQGTLVSLLACVMIAITLTQFTMGLTFH